VLKKSQILYCVGKRSTLFPHHRSPDLRGGCAAALSGDRIVFPKVRLGVEVLEGRVAPAVTSATLAPPPVLIAPPPVIFAPVPVRAPLPSPLPPKPATNTTGTTSSILSGTVLGNYVSTLRMLNTASGFHFSGTAPVGQLGNVDVYAHLYSVGFSSIGNAHGQIELSNTKGTVTLQVLGPTQTRLQPLPTTFSYRIVSATGSFKTLKASGTMKLTRKIDLRPVRNGIEYVETGSFTLSL
jgi:hypothetical protein